MFWETNFFRSLIGQFKFTLCFDFGRDVIGAIHEGQSVSTLATLIKIRK